jgi:hypothetical protein
VQYFADMRNNNRAHEAQYRRNSLLELGGIDKDYFCYVEDVDLGFRLDLYCKITSDQMTGRGDARS